MSFRVGRDSDGDREFYNTITFPNGQVGRIYFQESYNSYTKTVYYNVYFLIANKKKSLDDDFYNKETGNTGLKALIWAKQQIVDFEKFIIEDIFPSIKIIISIESTNGQRGRIYDRYLTKLGYRKGKLGRCNALIKRIR